MKKNIKSAVESYVKRVVEQVDKIDTEEESGAQLIGGLGNHLLAEGGDFMRGMAINDPELRAMFEDASFNQDLNEEMREAINSINDLLRIRLSDHVINAIVTNRAFFNADPALAVDDFMEIMKSIAPKVIQEIAEYDQGVTEGSIRYDYDEIKRAAQTYEASKEGLLDF